MTLVRASDGLPGRLVSSWSREKLFYLQRYFDIFSTAMRGKWILVYADLFSGPGLCVEKGSGEEFAGSALLAVTREEFSRLFLNDIDHLATSALAARIGSHSSRSVRISTRDANDMAEEARAFLFPRGGRERALGVAVLDPQGFQISLDAIRRLTQDVRLDLMITFMTSHVRRFISTSHLANTLDRFIGSTDWRELIPQASRLTRITFGSLLELYQGQLRTLGYTYAENIRVPNTKGRTIYHLVFASKHQRGAEFFKKITQRDLEGQRRLRLFERQEAYSG